MKGRWLGLVLILVAACAAPIVLTPDAKLGRGEGTVVTAPGDNGNLKITVTVRDLPPPDKLVAGAQVYIVWLTPPSGGEPHNLGALDFDKTHTGTLSADTPFHNFSLYVTPETVESVTEPLGSHVLSARVDQ